jgi:phosphotransferase system HPr (HPr) family protein
MVKFQIVVTNKVGLHARPAAQFVETASKFKKTTIKARKLATNGQFMNAKSILSVLSLGVEQNDEIELQIEGDEEQAAADALRGLIAGNFGEA